MVEGYSPLQGETARVEGLRMLEMGFEHSHFGCMVPQVLGTLGCTHSFSGVQSKLWVCLPLGFYCCDNNRDQK